MGVIIFLLASALVIAVMFSIVFMFNLEVKVNTIEKQVKQLNQQINRQSHPIYFEED